jgi:hypothetical protein
MQEILLNAGDLRAGLAVIISAVLVQLRAKCGLAVILAEIYRLMMEHEDENAASRSCSWTI